MRIFLIICILIGILIPTLVIYVDQQDSPKLRVEIMSIEEIVLPTPTPSTPFVTGLFVPSYPPTVEPTSEPTVEPTVIPTIEPTITMTFNDLTTPQLKNREQVKWFMLWDKTDLNTYTPDFKCGQFARYVIASANAHGIEAKFVILQLDCNPIPHAIVMFPTVEDGEVFVDATCGDWWVEMNYGEGNYKSYSMTNPDVHWFYGDTLLGYGIYY
jgi:hypothetical protein